MNGNNQPVAESGNSDASFPLTPTLSSGEREKTAEPDSAVDLLILSDGTILIHNLTPSMAALLNEMNPQDDTIRPRVLVMSR